MNELFKWWWFVERLRCVGRREGQAYGAATGGPGDRNYVNGAAIDVSRTHNNVTGTVKTDQRRSN